MVDLRRVELAIYAVKGHRPEPLDDRSINVLVTASSASYDGLLNYSVKETSGFAKLSMYIVWVLTSGGFTPPQLGHCT